MRQHDCTVTPCNHNNTDSNMLTTHTTTATETAHMDSMSSVFYVSSQRLGTETPSTKTEKNGAASKQLKQPKKQKTSCFAFGEATCVQLPDHLGRQVLMRIMTRGAVCGPVYTSRRTATTNSTCEGVQISSGSAVTSLPRCIMFVFWCMHAIGVGWGSVPIFSGENDGGGKNNLKNRSTRRVQARPTLHGGGLNAKNLRRMAVGSMLAALWL